MLGWLAGHALIAWALRNLATAFLACQPGVPGLGRRRRRDWGVVRPESGRAADSPHPTQRWRAMLLVAATVAVAAASCRRRLSRQRVVRLAFCGLDQRATRLSACQRAG